MKINTRVLILALAAPTLALFVGVRRFAMTHAARPSTAAPSAGGAHPDGVAFTEAEADRWAGVVTSDAELKPRIGAASLLVENPDLGHPRLVAAFRDLATRDTRTDDDRIILGMMAQVPGVLADAAAMPGGIPVLTLATADKADALLIASGAPLLTRLQALNELSQDPTVGAARLAAAEKTLGERTNRPVDDTIVYEILTIVRHPRN